MLCLNKTYKQQRFRYFALARCMAWANISVQVLFPLAVTFTPTMAARAHNAGLPRLSAENTVVVLTIMQKKISRRLLRMPVIF